MDQMTIGSFKTSFYKSSKKLLNICNCWFHKLHGSLQTGHSAAKRNINSVLRNIYNILPDKVDLKCLQLRY